jgi:hypothetical protein
MRAGHRIFRGCSLQEKRVLIILRDEIMNLVAEPHMVMVILVPCPSLVLP